VKNQKEFSFFIILLFYSSIIFFLKKRAEKSERNMPAIEAILSDFSTLFR
jgi:hypothetical protein